DLVEAAAWMMRLNRDAAEIAIEVGVRAATDITGFGLLGHATELAEASGVTLYLDAARIPLLPGAEQYAAAWIFPGGSAANRRAYERGVRVAGDLPEHRLMLLFDAQTSGGLLIALPPDQREVFAAQMAARQAPWWEVGQVEAREDVPLVVHA
ncbi:MAG: AIR synthase-related protein, partial [Chloroflexota bacterium]